MSAFTTQTQFSPSEDAAAYRQALGHFTTGIAVVTAQVANRWIGITVNSFASVSLSPPLILWSPDKKSARHDPFVQAQDFAVHILSSEQKSICDGFVKSSDAFDPNHTVLSDQGVPIIPNALATFECETQSTIDAGDHTIILGKVNRVSFADGDPLVFWRGQISKFDRTNLKTVA